MKVVYGTVCKVIASSFFIMTASMGFSMASNISLSLAEKQDSNITETIYHSQKMITKLPKFDTDVFSSISIRLNQEIYEITASVVNQEHFKACYGNVDTPFYQSWVKYCNPLMFMAIPMHETPMWADTRYTFTSAIYSRLLLTEANPSVDMSMLHIAEVDSDFYYAIGLEKYLEIEESNNTNDADSVGPVQKLWRYGGGIAPIKFNCGESFSDHMCWKDNVEVIFHNWQGYINSDTYWYKEHEIKSDIEEFVIVASVHNAGISAFRSGLNPDDISSTNGWLYHRSLMDFAETLGEESVQAVFQKHIDHWYEDVKIRAMKGERWNTPHQELNALAILEEAGIDYKNYNRGAAHAEYVINSVLNYMGLKRLYYSGE